MGTTLEAFGVVTGDRHDGARELADAAIERCLADAGLAASEIDLLINCGIYREGNLGEPALAAMIQEDVGANLGHPPVGGHGTFSFDVAAGACGPMTAMQIVDGFVRSGVVRHGLVVASDAHPGRGHAREFPYSPIGAATLLSATPGAVGFSHFTTALFPEHAGDVRAEVHWEPARRRVPWSAPGRNVLVLDRSEDFAAHAVAGALAVAERTLDQQGLGPEDVSVIITPDAEGIGTSVVHGLRRPGVVAGDGAHTAAVLIALARARDEGHLDEGRALVVTVSAGLHVSCALYECAR